MLHHWVTIILITTSWYFGLMQFGCIVMFCHDISDFLLAITKVFRYNRWKILTNIFYGLFTCSWIIFRIFLFSYKMIYSLLVEAKSKYDCTWWYQVFVIKLLLLLILHFYWGKMIVAMAFNAMFSKKGKVDDTRSDTEKDKKEK